MRTSKWNVKAMLLRLCWTQGDGELIPVGILRLQVWGGAGECLSKELPGDVGAVDLWTTLGKLPVYPFVWCLEHNSACSINDPICTIIPKSCDPMTVVHQTPLSMEFSRQSILEWVAISSSRESSQPRDWTQVSNISCIGRRILYHCTTWEVIPKSRYKATSEM